MQVTALIGSQGRLLSRIAACWLIFFAVTGCATQLTVSRIKPAEINLRGVNRISIYEIGGQDGSRLESMLTQALFDSKRFEMLERSALDKVLHEQGMTLDAAFDGRNVQLGKMLPASAIVSGQVSKANYEENMRDEQGTCSRSDGNGKSHDYSCTTHIRHGTASYVADLRLLDTTTGRLLATKALHAAYEASTSAIDNSPAQIDGNGMLETCRKDVVEQFLHVIAPFRVNENVTLVDDGDIPELKKGNQYLVSGDTATAVEYYGKAAAKANASKELSAKSKAKAHYGLGLGLALVGDYKTSLDEMKMANSLFDDDDWLAMEIRIKQWQKEAAAVEQQQQDASAQVATAGEAGD